MLRSRARFPCLAAIATLSACADGRGGTTPAEDVTTPADTGQSDATSGDDATSPELPIDPATCSRSGFDIVDQEYFYELGVDPETGVSGRRDHFTAVNGAGTALVIDVRSSDGGEATTSAVDHLEIRPPCATLSCARYKAVSGTLSITHVDPTQREYAGVITDARLVLTASDGTVSADDVWCIDELTFDFDPSCEVDTDCPDPEKPHCDFDSGVCRNCVSSFQCAPDRPICDNVVSDWVCQPPTKSCPDDDANEPNNGPSVATPLTLGAPIDGAICNPEGEATWELDWYVFDVPKDRTALFANLTWTADDPGLELLLYNEGLVLTQNGLEHEGSTWQTTRPLGAGRYYAHVRLDGEDGTVPYRLVIEGREKECDAQHACPGLGSTCETFSGQCEACASYDGFDCTANRPACIVGDDGLRTCAMIDLCTGDDVPDDDDGPKAATPLGFGESVSAHVCGGYGADTDHEADWYRVDVESARELSLSIEWGGGHALGVSVIDEDGVSLDYSDDTLDIAVPAGITYLRVGASAERASDPHTAVPYTLTLGE